MLQPPLRPVYPYDSFKQTLTYSLQPALLNLYDTHFLPLQQGLRPIMKSFIIALLPGLEEETGEYFDKARLRGFFGSNLA